MNNKLVLELSLGCSDGAVNLVVTHRLIFLRVGMVTLASHLAHLGLLQAAFSFSLLLFLFLFLFFFRTLQNTTRTLTCI